MRVALLHNAAAGSEDHTDQELVDDIQQAGHEVAHVSTTVDALLEALRERTCDLVVIAGGDGTVSRAACQLAGQRLPLSILPLGTANNTAISLAMPQQPGELAKSWDSARRVPFDLAVLDDGTVSERFAEAAGWGVFPRSIVKAKQQGSAGSVRETLGRNRQLFHEHSTDAPPRYYRIEVDGRDCSGEYLLVEIVNVPLIGPQLPLSPRSDPSDGLLEVILAGPAERAHLEQLASAESPREGALRTERGAQIRVTASEGLLHIDGRLVRHPEGDRTFSITVEAHAVEYLRAAREAD